MSQEDIRSIVREELSQTDLDAGLLRELKASMALRSSQLSSSLVNNSGIRKSSQCKRDSLVSPQSSQSSQMRRTPRPSLSSKEFDRDSVAPLEKTFEFGFGRHAGQTIYQVIAAPGETDKIDKS